MKKVLPFLVCTVKNCLLSSSAISSTNCPFPGTEKGKTKRTVRIWNFTTAAHMSMKIRMILMKKGRMNNVFGHC